ncbi:MAG TPA: hypothetical protein VKQ30_09725 [Ktedonobacterales bacterium]|nr:hypothetical protein [Ktedonobacterales bacterium]
MRDGTPPRGARGPRGGENVPGRRYNGAPPPPSYPPARGPAPNVRPDNPYRPYGEPTGSRLPAPYQRGTLGTFNRLPATGHDFAVQDNVDEAESHRKRLGFAIFHDGNPGHLWRGSVASTLGEGLLSVGVLMWLATLTLSPLVVALAVAALGVPFVLAGPLAARFESLAEPGTLLRWTGRLRIVFTLALIVMHFRTVLPVVYLLLFAISFCGRLHDALRVAVIRTCLARGEPEHVANDLHVGSALAAVLGPLIATLCYILLGERILLVAATAAVFFIISLNSEGFLDTLPPNRRDFLLASPETASSGEDWPDALSLDGERDDDDRDPAERREHALPAWYQLGPTNGFRALGEIRAGLSLAGVTQASTVALWALAALSLAGGGVAVLEVFYIVQSLNLPPFYLGPLLAAEGGGLALGALIGGTADASGPWRIRLLFGLVGSGAALAALTRMPELPLVLAACFALGAFNALAVQAARQGLLDGFNGIERRALAAAESAVVALCAVLGTLAVAALYGDAVLPVHLPISLAGWSAADLMFVAGVGLVAATVVFAVLLSFRSRAAAKRANAPAAGAFLPALDDEDESDYAPMTGEHDAWAESDARDWTGMSPAADDDYAASYGSQGTGYGPATRRPRGNYANDDDYEEMSEGYDDFDDDLPGRRGGQRRRPPQEKRRPRW